MATVPPDSDGSAAREGYYPDPSIPGYVRYWNGVSWVPGTSRPAPAADEAPPTPPPGAAPAPAPSLAAVPPVRSAPAEETGPVFLDEPEATSAPAAPGQGAQPQPAWHADAAHQSGFGGDQDRRVSWGRPVDPRGLPEADPRLPDPRRPEPAGTPHPVPNQQQHQNQQQQSSRQHQPNQQQPQHQPNPQQPQPQPQPQPQRGRLAGTLPPAAVEPSPVRDQLAATADPLVPASTGRADGSYTAQARPSAPAAARPSPQQADAQADPVPGSPMTAGPGGGAASWAQQVHRLAQPDPQGPAQGQPQEPVVPWKPPVADPFFAAAQAQAAARPAGLGRRLIARLVDTVLLGALVGGLAVPLLTQVGDHIQEKIDAAKLSGRTVTVYLLDGTTAGFLGMVLGGFLVLGLLYEAVPTAKWGRTLGKRLCGVQVRGIESYEPPTFGQAARRWLVYGVLGLLAVGVVNAAWCLFDRPWRQCWHDKAARTFVAQG
ncbi:RDD family protein [Streptomyces sp. NBC_00083]|uniref:RDD family protein n=1 Tax=Streptomyces sp. NBC_00083 TaxID=2975647 RepID=UPI002254031B|nr:RDD family protein [Streptomyces sp. NBC_00083]MCX5382181.1 RDD family protein [Streptomyces sp. NBC_00083]